MLRPNRFRTGALALLAAVALPVEAGAQELLESVRSSGMADAFTGGGTGNGALYRNPAGLHFASLYSLEAGYQFDGPTELHTGNISVVDSMTNPWVAGGFGFAYSLGPGEEPTSNLDDVRARDLRGGLALPVLPGRIALGISAHQSSQYAGREGDVEDGDRIVHRGWTGDAGLMVSPGGPVTLGIAGRNLLTIDDLPLPRTFAAGLALFVGDMHIEGEWTMDLDVDGADRHGWAGGLEYAIQMVPVRFGYRHDGPTGTDRLTGGFGWRSEVAGFDLTYGQNVSGPGGYWLGLSISAYM